MKLVLKIFKVREKVLRDPQSMWITLKCKQENRSNGGDAEDGEREWEPRKECWTLYCGVCDERHEYWGSEIISHTETSSWRLRTDDYFAEELEEL